MLLFVISLLVVVNFVLYIFFCFSRFLSAYLIYEPTLAVTAANNNCIPILGAALLIKGSSADGGTKEMRQVVYVTKRTDRFFLSRQACVELGIISSTFPTVGEVGAIQDDDEVSKDSILQLPSSVSEVSPAKSSKSAFTSGCQCLERKMPPPKLSKLPFPATEENRSKLQEWLVDYYNSFNTCSHQPLPCLLYTSPSPRDS